MEIPITTRRADAKAVLEGCADKMNSCYKVHACCSASGCDYVQHIDIIRTINHESSFSFSMLMNGVNDLDAAMRCPSCGQRMFYYPVTYIEEPVYYE